MKIISALLSTSVYGLILLVVYFLHVNFLNVDVVFYAAIFDGVLASILAGILLWKMHFFSKLGDFEKFLLFVIWLMTGYACAISVPTVIDRSLSFYILEKIHQRGGGIRLNAFEQVFTQEYMKEHRLVDIRITEQVQSGTITIENGCVLLTPKGVVIASISRDFRKNWLPKKRLISGEYTDELTDPFRFSVSVEKYACTKL